MSAASSDGPRGPREQDDERTVIVGAVTTGVALPFGHALQEYAIEGVVGEGGFSIVYRARDTRLGRIVALKEYMPSNLANRSSDYTVSVRSERHRETFELGLRSFVNEAQLLASFDHPSLVKVYRFWEENGTAYMVMPLYQGPTLKKWLSEIGSAPDEHWLMALLVPMIDALEHLHNDLCYHRDIAPDNILLLPLPATQTDAKVITVRPLLLDFGAARRVIGDMTHALTVILKPGYAPIEQYADSASMKQGPWTDVYALSAVLYHCVTGRAPVPSVTRIIADDMVPAARAGLGRYSPWFLEAIDAGLGVRPDARPQSMAALRALFPAMPPRGEVPLRPLSASDRELAPATRIDPVMTAGPGYERIAPAWRAQETAPALMKKPEVPPGRLRVGFSLLAVTLLAGGSWWWLSPRNGDASGPSVTVKPADSTVPASPAPMVGTTEPAATPASPVVAMPPAVVEPVPFSVLAALQDIVDRADPQLSVTAIADKSVFTIGKDLMKFRVKSTESGYLYIFFGGTDKNHFNLLFPNQLDKNNRVEAGREVVLPRTKWAMEATGPPGTNHIVALVSRHIRDLSGTGLLRRAETAEFDLSLAQQRWAQRTTAPPTISPFIGKALCSNGPCDEAYGATLFEITEVAGPAPATR